jgi:PAS domain
MDTCVYNCTGFMQGPATSSVVIDQLREDLALGKNCALIVRNYTKAGVPFDNFLRVVPLKADNGIITHFLGVLRDVSGHM